MLSLCQQGTGALGGAVGVSGVWVSAPLKCQKFDSVTLEHRPLSMVVRCCVTSTQRAPCTLSCFMLLAALCAAVPGDALPAAGADLGLSLIHI